MRDKKGSSQRANANGEGSLYQLGDGRWQCAVTIGRDPTTGKPIRRTRTRQKRADAAAALRQLLNDIDAGEIPAPANLTVEQLCNLWLNDHVAANSEVTTTSNYRRTVKNHITPHLGEIQMKKLSPLYIARWLADLERNGIGSGARKHAYRTLCTAINYAISLQLIGKNPCALVDSPKHRRKKINPFTIEETMEILSATEIDPLHGVYVLGFHHGLRYGEIFGLPPENVDFKNGVLHVRQQLRTVTGHPPSLVEPKTESSIRTIELTPKAADALNERRKFLMSKGRSGDKLLFMAARGGIMWPQAWYRSYFRPALDKLGIERRGFHHTRHTFATMALGAGEPLHVVSAILGHSNPTMTLTMYAHYMPTDQARVTAAMSRLLG